MNEEEKKVSGDELEADRLHKLANPPQTLLDELAEADAIYFEGFDGAVLEK